MAEGKTRIYNLPEVTTVNSDMFLMLDSGSTGARKYNMKTLYDKVDGVETAAANAAAAAASATSAATSANDAATAATDAATSATTTVDGLVEDVNEALEAIGDISELAVPLMSDTTRGGAKVGRGLAVDDGALRVSVIAEGTEDAGQVAELTANGVAGQDTTSGKNLLPKRSQYAAVNGITYTFNDDGSVTLGGTATAQSSLSIATATVTAGQAYTGSGVTGGSNSTYMLNYCERNGSSWAADHLCYSSVTFTPQYDTVRCDIIVKSGVTVNTTIYPMLELGSTATTYEPYTGGAPSPSPSYQQEIRRVTGHTISGKTGRFVDVDVQSRNLMPNIPSSYTSGATWVSFGEPVDFDGIYLSFYFSGSFTYGGAAFIALVREDGTTSPVTMGYMRLASDNTAPVAGTTYSHEKMTFILSSVSGNYTEIRLYTSPAFTNPKFEECVLNNSNTPMDYTPYYHTTIPIPLPSRGWVAGLPDGTADSVTIDGAGGVVWTLATNMVTFDGDEVATMNTSNSMLKRTGYAVEGIRTWTNSSVNPHYLLCDHFIETSNADAQLNFVVSVNVRSTGDEQIVFNAPLSDFPTITEWTSWLQSNPVTVLYPLATTVTETCAFVDWPEIPEGASISCEELDAVHVSYYADSGVSRLAREYYARAKSEYESYVLTLQTEIDRLDSRITLLSS